MYNKAGGTGSGTSLASGANSRVPTDFEWADEACQTQQSTIRAEIPTPEHLVKERQKGQNRQNNHRGYGHTGEEVQHLDIADRPVGSIQEPAQRFYRHVQQDELREQQKQQILDTSQEDVEPVPDGKIPTEQLPAQLVGTFGEGSDRAKPGTERFLGKQAHEQDRQKNNQCCWMDRVYCSRNQPVL